jgi:glycosyltransferase involved in cell wall biosynthesis
LNTAKGQDLAIEALAQEPLAARKNVRLLLAGHGEELPALEALVAKHGLEQAVMFLGWRDDLPKLMAMTDLVLLPSRWEGMPYIVLEAMAAGKPVVATRVDGASDLVSPGETGELVDIGDSAGMARAVAGLFELGDGALAGLGAGGRARLLESYTIEHMVAATRGVFREAIRESGAASGTPAGTTP